MLKAVLQAKLCNTFHKLNVHAGECVLSASTSSYIISSPIAMRPADIKDFFEPVFRQAQVLKNAYDSAVEEKKKKIKLPFVTVYAWDCSS